MFARRRKIIRALSLIIKSCTDSIDSSSFIILLSSANLVVHLRVCGSHVCIYKNKKKKIAEKQDDLNIMRIHKICKKKDLQARRAWATFNASLTSSNAFLSVHLQFVYQWGTLFNHVVDVIVKEWDSILYIIIFIIIDDINNYIHKTKNPCCVCPIFQKAPMEFFIWKILSQVHLPPWLLPMATSDVILFVYIKLY